jgi:hypothetical protein
VELSWPNIGSQFKSPLRVVACFLWRSRERKAQKCRNLKQQLDEARQIILQQEVQLERQREEIGAWEQQSRQWEDQTRRQVQLRGVLPDDPPLKGHRFGCRLICLAVNLVRVVGLRATERVLKMVWEWLGVSTPVPHWTTIRQWTLRVGVAALKEPLARADDWVWMADHSNQIGPEKVLVVLGIRAAQMPPSGETLRHADIHLLTVRPGKTWKREDVAAVYRELAERHGVPRAVLCDGAVELRDSVECLKKQRGEVLVLQDFKHKAAIFLQSIVGNDPRFAEFATQLGRCRAAIQQTELAHLTPPSQKPKARFMNLGPTLDWAATVLWLLEHPEAQARRWITTGRLEEKLGWVRSFATEMGAWRECQQVINAGVAFINEQGIFRGAAEKLRVAVGTNHAHAAGRQLAARLIDLVATSESQLQKGERLPMSTEILESTFALYKQLERQHSKGGFTTLLAGFGALLKKATQVTIRTAFSTVSTADVRRWTRDNLGDTLTSKRHATYREFQVATKLATTS